MNSTYQRPPLSLKFPNPLMQMVFDNENPTPKSPATCTVEDIEAEHQVSWECLETLFDNMLRSMRFKERYILSYQIRLGESLAVDVKTARSCTCLVDSIPNVRKPKDRLRMAQSGHWLDWSYVLVLMLDDVDRMCCFLLLFFLSFFLVSAAFTRSSAMFMCRYHQRQNF